MCPQLETFGYELGLRQVVRDPYTFLGSLYHVALAYWYALLLQVKPAWYVYASPEEAVRACGHDRLDLVDDALELFTVYTRTYPRESDPWQPVLVEMQLVSTAEGEVYSTRLDMLAWDPAVGYVLTNHKANARETKAAAYYTDVQVLTEIAQARASGYDVKKYYINEMVKKVVRRKGTTPPRAHRIPVNVSPVAYARIAADMGYYLRARQHVVVEFPDPMNRPRNYGACHGKYRLCDFYALCADGPARLHEYYVESPSAMPAAGVVTG